MIDVPPVNTSCRAEGMYPNTVRAALRRQSHRVRLGRKQILPGGDSGLEYMSQNGEPAIDAAALHGFDPAWLRDNCQCSLAGYTIAEPDSRSEDAKRLWSARDFRTGPQPTAWQAYLASNAVRLRCLRELLATGFMLLTGVPAEADAVLDVAETFGYVRETNNGRMFDVRVEAPPSNPAHADMPIGPHTDSPYCDPVPTIQLLHCLANAATAGSPGSWTGSAPPRSYARKIRPRSSA